MALRVPREVVSCENVVMSHVHYGGVFHVAGRPAVTGAAAALVSIPDGALVVDDSGRIVYCGERASVPIEFDGAVVHDHRPGLCCPASSTLTSTFRRPSQAIRTAVGSCWSGSTSASFPSEAKFADPEFAQRAAVEFCDRRVAAGTTAAMVFGSAFPHAQDALFTETQRRGLRIVSGRGIQTVGDDVATALLHVAIVPRFSLSVTDETLRNLGGLYDSVRERGLYVHTHLNENNRPGTGEVDASFYPARRSAARVFWAGAPSCPTACTARMPNWTGWPRPARPSRTVPSPNSSSARAPCRGSGRSRRA